MSAEAWTIETLKVHIDELRKADQKAIETAHIAFEKRMDSTNEWRAALDDQSKRLATIQQFELLKEQVEKLEVAHAAGANKAAGVGHTAYVLGMVIAAVAAILGIIFLFRGTS